MKILDNLKVILNPWVWMPHYKYSREWDIELKELLERETFTMPTFYETTLLGNFEIRNNYFSSTKLDVRPSRKTILLAKRKYEQDILRQIKHKLQI